MAMAENVIDCRRDGGERERENKERERESIAFFSKLKLLFPFLSDVAFTLPLPTVVFIEIMRFLSFSTPL
jgi:hypothetical protein